MLLAWLYKANAQYPSTTKEWDFMIQTGQDAADVRGGIPLQKGGNLPALNGPAGWRFPVITGLGWSFEGEEVACMWIYPYDLTSKQTVW